MLTSVHPKLPMRNREATKTYYLGQLGFRQLGDTDYADYLMVEKDNVQLHFFLFGELNPKENYGQVYIRTDDIDSLYESLLNSGVAIHPNGALRTRPWGQREFHLLDPDDNLLTFGQSVHNR